MQPGLLPVVTPISGDQTLAKFRYDADIDIVDKAYNRFQMSEYKIEARVEIGGDLHLHDLPFNPGEKVEVIVTRAPLSGVWPEGYFERTFGSIPDP